MAYDNYSDQDLLALCIWREARGETHAGKFAVGCSIRNRVQHPRWWGRDYRSVILDPWQYSSFNANDPNANKYPQPGDAAYDDAEACAQSVVNGDPDTTAGAVSYYDKSLDAHPPQWASSPQFKHSIDIGAFHFFALS